MIQVDVENEVLLRAKTFNLFSVTHFYILI